MLLIVKLPFYTGITFGMMKYSFSSSSTVFSASGRQGMGITRLLHNVNQPFACVLHIHDIVLCVHKTYCLVDGSSPVIHNEFSNVEVIIIEAVCDETKGGQ